MLKKTLVCATLLSVVFFALASSGGGKKKASTAAVKAMPLTSKGTFTLKTKPTYTGSQLLTNGSLTNGLAYRSVVTYQQGNTTYVIPSTYRTNVAKKLTYQQPDLSLRSNLNVIDLKIRLCR